MTFIFNYFTNDKSLMCNGISLGLNHNLILMSHHQTILGNINIGLITLTPVTYHELSREAGSNGKLHHSIVHRIINPMLLPKY